MKNTVCMEITVNFCIEYPDINERVYSVNSDVDVLNMEQCEAYDLYRCVMKFEKMIKECYDISEEYVSKYEV